LRRLDAVLRARHPGLSRAEVAEAVASGAVRVNGRRAAKGTKVGPRDEIDDAALAALEASGLGGGGAPEVEVAWEDEWLVGLYKPAGMPTQPIRHGEGGTLVDGMLARWPEMTGVGGDALCPAVVHRIDIGTSGLVLAAKTAEAYAAMRGMFRRGEVEKTYLALVAGRVTEGGRMEAALRHRTRHPCRMELAEDGRDGEHFAAATEWMPLGAPRQDDTTLLEVKIRSGVTHQIRCHLAAAGTPIVGDTLYGGPEWRRTGHALHSWAAAFRHPATGAATVVRARRPEWG
jgi:23S rRNA pseudouridine1911/1915/1917 synthase